MGIRELLVRNLSGGSDGQTLILIHQRTSTEYGLRFPHVCYLNGSQHAYEGERTTRGKHPGYEGMLAGGRRTRKTHKPTPTQESDSSASHSEVCGFQPIRRKHKAPTSTHLLAKSLGNRVCERERDHERPAHPQDAQALLLLLSGECSEWNEWKAWHASRMCSSSLRKAVCSEVQGQQAQPVETERERERGGVHSQSSWPLLALTCRQPCACVCACANGAIFDRVAPRTRRFERSRDGATVSGCSRQAHRVMVAISPPNVSPVSDDRFVVRKPFPSLRSSSGFALLGIAPS